jgi:hypothetical protein
MLVEFSDTTATRLKAELPKIGQLFGTNEDKNKLDLTSIKQLKGCRTQLVQNYLKFIQELDRLVSNDEIKNYALESRLLLIESLKKYLGSCERYSRIKDFLNIIPDHTSGMVGFIIILSTYIATTSPVLAIIPVSILTWGLIDLFFNNRTAVKNFRTTLFNAEEELREILKPCNLLKHNTPPPETQATPLLAAIPSTSRNYDSFEETTPPIKFFKAQVHTVDTQSIHSDSSSLTLV